MNVHTVVLVERFSDRLAVEAPARRLEAMTPERPRPQRMSRAPVP
jgi:hypothetical protein